METKRFTVVDTRSNTVKTFNSEATTVGELKQDLINIGIDPTGMAIQEGLTKTELSGDATELPKNVTYRGTVTNNLVFRLTQPDKKIKSGADNCSRSDVYDKIKELNLGTIIKAKYGNNYTNVKTADLVNEVQKAMQELENENKDLNLNPKGPLVDAIATLTNILFRNGTIKAPEANSIVEPLIGVKLFDEGEEACPAPFQYDLEEIFGDCTCN